MRYVIFGPGAIGGTIGGRLHQAGREVVLIARGPHLAALREIGLRLRSPDGDVVLKPPAVGAPNEVRIEPGDVVVLAMKSQDTAAALAELRQAAPPEVAIVCAQNGVANERAALRFFAGVYGMFVWMGVDHLVPGEIANYRSPVYGWLDLGRCPGDADALAEQIASDLTAAGFLSRSLADPMRWKYGKLLQNLGNALNAITGSREGRHLLDAARAEALACFQAAGIAFASSAELSERSRLLPPARPIGGQIRTGSSSWQSLARGQGSIGRVPERRDHAARAPARHPDARRCHAPGGSEPDGARSCAAGLGIRRGAGGDGRAWRRPLTLLRPRTNIAVSRHRECRRRAAPDIRSWGWALLEVMR